MAARRGRLRRVVGEILHRLREHDLMMMGAAIAFYWLLSLIPLLLLGTSAIGYLMGSSDRAVDEVVAVARRAIPRATAKEVDSFVRAVVSSRRVAGVVGMGFLLWVAMGVFEMIIASLTALSGEKETRSYFRRKLVAFIMMLTVGFFLIATLVGSWFLAAWPNIEGVLGLRIVLPAFLTAPRFPYYFTSILMGILFTVVYRIAPVNGVRWPAAMVGATVAAVLWHQAKVVFNWYVTHYARYSVLYGILGGAIGLVLWMLYTAVILLFGGLLAEVVDQTRHPTHSRK